MDVSVTERKFTFAAEYDITAPDAIYHAHKTWFALTDQIRLKAEDGREVADIQGSFSPLREKHDFKLADGREFHFQCVDLWKRVFTCEGRDGGNYQFFEHKGLRYSVFRDNRQTASIEKNSIVWGKGNEYSIRMDSDADLVVIVCMVLAINSAEESDNNQTVNIDLGRIGPEDHPFDESWEPR